IDEQARADYFDSIFHSAAVVGINTSAFIEAGIVGRPVFTIVMPDYEDNQHGTVHFDYLLKAGGGLLSAATGVDAHLAQLSAALYAPQSGVKPFVREFVRPLGLDRAATPVFVDAVESMTRMPVEAPSRDALMPVWRWMLRRVAGMRDNDAYETW